MRLTEVAERPPRACAVTNREEGPFVDFQVLIDPPTNTPTSLYLHTLIVEEAGKLLGMVSAKEVEKLRAEFAELSTEMDELRSMQKAADELEQHVGREKERVA